MPRGSSELQYSQEQLRASQSEFGTLARTAVREPKTGFVGRVMGSFDATIGAEISRRQDELTAYIKRTATDIDKQMEQLKERQRQAEPERQRQLELERQKQAELERQRQLELDDEPPKPRMPRP